MTRSFPSPVRTDARRSSIHAGLQKCARPGAAALLCFVLAFPAWGLEKVVLQLRWQHQFEFAGYYAAVDKGFYQDAGLEVELREGAPGLEVVDAVVHGEAHFGVGNSELLLARSVGKPVVALAVILQHSPIVLLARRDESRVVQGLAGRRLMVEPDASELFAYLRREGLRDDSYRLEIQVPDPATLMTGRADAISAYSTNEPFILRQAGFPYSMFSPRSAGIDFYGDNLFTSEGFLQDKPALVAAFREASLQGWRYAMEHPEEMADLILARYSKRHSREHLLFEAAEMDHLMQPALVEIGHMNPGRWRHMADIYGSLGMLPAGFSIDGLLYDARPARLPPWVLTAFFLVSVTVVLVGAVAWRFAYFNRALNAEIQARKEAERIARQSEAEALDANARLRTQLEEVAHLQAALKELAIRDPLTGLYNRRYLDETMDREIARARRERTTLCMVMLDIDHFKRLNDTHGHQTGDIALRAVGEILRHDVRAEDIPCRYGGEEFLILLPRIPLAAAAERAERWRRAIEGIRLEAEGVPVRLTASLGLAAFPDHAETQDVLTRNADAALYRAKHQGRNRVVVFSSPPPGTGT